MNLRRRLSSDSRARPRASNSLSSGRIVLISSLVPSVSRVSIGIDVTPLPPRHVWPCSRRPSRYGIGLAYPGRTPSHPDGGGGSLHVAGAKLLIAGAIVVASFTPAKAAGPLDGLLPPGDQLPPSNHGQ